jgi:diguanylate cyclase (GGDEF)-like protein
LHPVHDPSRERMVGVLFIARPEAEEPARRERNSLAAASSIITLAVERFEAESELSHIGLHDPLTDLPNRRMFFERLQHSLTNADESTGTTAVLFVDLDHFKLVNDGLGHDAGDALLVEVGRRLRRVVRPDDTVARLGGDEFVIACNAVHDPADAARLADRVLEALARPISIDGREVLMTASVGIAISEGRDADEADAIMRRADAAMYRAKRLGRARVAGVE